jgi:predicted GIY-YIG superfamily endonuclease
MNNNTLIVDHVCQPRETKQSFAKVVQQFPAILSELRQQQPMAWRDYFGPGRGRTSTKKMLLAEGKAHWFREDAPDFRGLYVWYHKEHPFYVGISNNVLQRVGQHAKAKDHYSASMAYKIARDLWPTEEKTRRADYDQENIAVVREWLMDQHLRMMPINDFDQLALFEIFCAMELGCSLNGFEPT